MGNPDKMEVVSEVFKVDTDERLVYGWAYVSTVNGEISLDHSGEYVSPDTLVKAATNFMLDIRIAKANHDGDQVGSVVHSLPITKELSEALGIQTDREGWIIAMKIHDEGVWQMVKSGKLTSFSIGGRALREAM